MYLRNDGKIIGNINEVYNILECGVSLDDIQYKANFCYFMYNLKHTDIIDRFVDKLIDDKLEFNGCIYISTESNEVIVRLLNADTNSAEKVFEAVSELEDRPYDVYGYDIKSSFVTSKYNYVGTTILCKIPYTTYDEKVYIISSLESALCINFNVSQKVITYRPYLNFYPETGTIYERNLRANRTFLRKMLETNASFIARDESSGIEKFETSVFSLEEMQKIFGKSFDIIEIQNVDYVESLFSNVDENKEMTDSEFNNVMDSMNIDK